MSDNLFQRFAALHVSGDPLVLFNVWDVGSAQAVAKSGAKAIATGSASVAMANGFGDGEQVPIDFALANARRIVEAVELPVTVDFEGAYSDDPAEGGAQCRAAGGDRRGRLQFRGPGGRRRGASPDRRSRPRGSRRPGEAVGPDFFINARTDLFLKAPQETHDAAMLDEAIERGLGLCRSRGERLFRADAGRPRAGRAGCAASRRCR